MGESDGRQHREAPNPDCRGMILPDVEHHLELQGPVHFPIGFFDRKPLRDIGIERKKHA